MARDRRSGARRAGAEAARWHGGARCAVALSFDSDHETNELRDCGESIRDDAVYFNMNRFQGLRPYTAPADVFDIFRREFDGAYREGGIFQLTMHPPFSGYRSRIWILDELIRYIRGHADVWFATHAEIAAYAKAHAA